MRIGFGLISLLVVLGIMMVIFKTYEAPQIEVGHKAQEEVQQISGHDENGAPAYKSYQAEEYDVAGKFLGIKVTALTPGGAMEKYYGLKAGDVVLQVGALDAVTLGDYGSAKGQLDEAYQKAAPLLVLRDGAKISLPVGGAKSPLDSLNIPMH